MGRVVDFVIFLYAVTPLTALTVLLAGGTAMPPRYLAGVLLYSAVGTIASAYAYFRYGRNQQRSLSGRLLEVIGGILLILFFLAVSLVCAVGTVLAKMFATKKLAYIFTE